MCSCFYILVEVVEAYICVSSENQEIRIYAKKIHELEDELNMLRGEKLSLYWHYDSKWNIGLTFIYR